MRPSRLDAELLREDSDDPTAENRRLMFESVVLRRELQGRIEAKDHRASLGAWMSDAARRHERKLVVGAEYGVSLIVHVGTSFLHSLDETLL
jgi:hypothetical protein